MIKIQPEQLKQKLQEILWQETLHNKIKEEVEQWTNANQWKEKSLCNYIRMKLGTKLATTMQEWNFMWAKEIKHM